ncbi:MAG: M20 family metallo-hydrolase [Rhodospirillales bacterium]
MALTEADLSRLAAAVDEERLWQMHMEMAKFGATPRGGVCRECLTPEDIQARLLLKRWAEDLGCDVSIDAIGNMFVRRNGSDMAAPPIATGSHLDSQPTGGKFDGAYGVLAGIEMLYAMRDANIQTERSIEVVNFTNEEGGRFQPGVMGSQVFVRPNELERMLAVVGTDGVTMADALAGFMAEVGPVNTKPLKAPFAGFVEAHIEQAPRLEETGNTIGVVTGIQGARKYQVTVKGEEAHSGTMPMRRRKDAVLAASKMVVALHELMADPDDLTRFNVGRFQAYPGAPSVVPGEVRFSIDFRCPNDDQREVLGNRIAEVCSTVAGPCDVEVNEIQRAETTPFDQGVMQIIARAADRINCPRMDLLSGAAHDARNMVRICPTGMVFIPCEGGISHNEVESATPSDLAAGARVIAQTVAEMAG